MTDDEKTMIPCFKSTHKRLCKLATKDESWDVVLNKLADTYEKVKKKK